MSRIPSAFVSSLLREELDSLLPIILDQLFATGNPNEEADERRPSVSAILHREETQAHMARVLKALPGSTQHMDGMSRTVVGKIKPELDSFARSLVSLYRQRVDDSMNNAEFVTRSRGVRDCSELVQICEHLKFQSKEDARVLGETRDEVRRLRDQLDDKQQTIAALRDMEFQKIMQRSELLLEEEMQKQVEAMLRHEDNDEDLDDDEELMWSGISGVIVPKSRGEAEAVKQMTGGVKRETSLLRDRINKMKKYHAQRYRLLLDEYESKRRETESQVSARVEEAVLKAQESVANVARECEEKLLDQRMKYEEFREKAKEKITTLELRIEELEVEYAKKDDVRIEKEMNWRLARMEGSGREKALREQVEDSQRRLDVVLQQLNVVEHRLEVSEEERRKVECGQLEEELLRKREDLEMVMKEKEEQVKREWERRIELVNEECEGRTEQKKREWEFALNAEEGKFEEEKREREGNRKQVRTRLNARLEEEKRHYEESLAAVRSKSRDIEERISGIRREETYDVSERMVREAIDLYFVDSMDVELFRAKCVSWLSSLVSDTHRQLIRDVKALEARMKSVGAAKELMGNELLETRKELGRMEDEKDKEILSLKCRVSDLESGQDMARMKRDGSRKVLGKLKPSASLLEQSSHSQTSRDLKPSLSVTLQRRPRTSSGGRSSRNLRRSATIMLPKRKSSEGQRLVSE